MTHTDYKACYDNMLSNQTQCYMLLACVQSLHDVDLYQVSAQSDLHDDANHSLLGCTKLQQLQV